MDSVFSAGTAGPLEQIIIHSVVQRVRVHVIPAFDLDVVHQTKSTLTPYRRETQT